MIIVFLITAYEELRDINAESVIVVETLWVPLYTGIVSQVVPLCL
jgi:hypothetical protein